MRKRIIDRIVRYLLTRTFRKQVIQQLFSEDDRYMIKRAIDYRKSAIEESIIGDRWVYAPEARADVEDYSRIGREFTTDDWH